MTLLAQYFEEDDLDALEAFNVKKKVNLTKITFRINYKTRNFFPLTNYYLF